MTCFSLTHDNHSWNPKSEKKQVKNNEDIEVTIFATYSIITSTKLVSEFCSLSVDIK